MFVAEQLGPDEYPNVEQWMLRPPGNNLSFTHHMHLKQRYVPDAYLLTAYSAVPIADSLRGFYASLGQQVPQLHYVRADTSTSREVDLRRIRVADEVARLKPLLTGMTRVCIIDQYHATCKTSGMAIEIAKQCGIHQVFSIVENWYQNADRDDIDLVNMTSIHALFMNYIGRQAAHNLPHVTTHK